MNIIFTHRTKQIRHLHTHASENMVITPVFGNKQKSPSHIQPSHMWLSFWNWSPAMSTVIFQYNINQSHYILIIYRFVGRQMVSPKNVHAQTTWNFRPQKIAQAVIKNNGCNNNSECIFYQFRNINQNNKTKIGESLAWHYTYPLKWEFVAIIDGIHSVAVNNFSFKFLSNGVRR